MSHLLRRRTLLARFGLGAGACVLALMSAGCDGGSSPSRAGTFSGQNVAVGNGTARSFVTLNSAGNPTMLGFTVSQSAYDSFVATPPQTLSAQHAGSGDGHIENATEFTLPLPAVATSKTPFDHISFDWQPQGHPPIYFVPHFDVHFYTISLAERADITPGSDSSVPALDAKYLPANYSAGPPGTVPGTVPGMGIHYLDSTAPEFNGQPFTATMVYGSTKGKINFLEPMFAKSFLDAKPNFSTEIKQPSAVQETSYYPTKYTVSYDATNQQYIFTLTDFVLRQAS